MGKTRGNRKRRQKLFDVGLKYCNYCGKVLTMEDSTLDHIVPKSQGGTNEFRNLTLACDPCNQKKDNAEVFLWGEPIG